MATINVSCTYASISAGCAAANEGDTVLIAAGSCTITGTISIDRNISFTIAGSGIDVTTLTSGSGLSAVIFIFSNSSNTFTVRDMTCVTDVSNSGGFFVAGWNGKSNPGSYHFQRIKMPSLNARGISVGRGPSTALIDHCQFVSAATGSPQAIDYNGALYTSWALANPIGTANACFCEDCTFDFALGGGNGFFDAYDGADLVFRHNTCNGGAPSGVHGYDSGTSSARSWEVYENTFTNMSQSTCFQMRGGTGVVYNNTMTGSGTDVCLLIYYRSTPLAHPYGSISGYLLTGQAGFDYVIDFTNANPNNGQGQPFNGQPNNNDTITIGFTTYTFVSSYANGGVGAYGGGNVVIGANLAATITNLYNCINLGTGAGVTYAASAQFGHDFLATGHSSTQLTLRNALDDNTNQYGYIANQQPGVIQSYPLTSNPFTNSQVLSPAYSWGNKLNGSSKDFALGDDQSQYGFLIRNYLQPNRDYVNGTSKPGYAPYTYPHPLQGPTAIINATTVNVTTLHLG